MSYILDALTRSEQERNRGSVPDLHTEQAPFAQFEGPHASRTVYLVAGVLLAGAGAAAGWLHAYDTARMKAAPVQAEPVALQLPRPLAAMPKPPAPAPADPAPSEKPAEESPPPVRVAPTPKSQRASPPVLTARAAVTPAQSSPRTPAMQPREERVLPPSELPPALQKELPPLAISGFADSRDTGRMAIVNGRVVVEGDEFAGLTVEQIAPGSLTLRYKDHRFRQAY